MTNAVTQNQDSYSKFLDTIVELIRLNISDIEEQFSIIKALKSNTEINCMNLFRLESAIRSHILIPSFGGGAELNSINDISDIVELKDNDEIRKALTGDDPIINKVISDIYKNLLYFKLNNINKGIEVSNTDKTEVINELKNLFNNEIETINECEIKLLLDTIFLAYMHKNRDKVKEEKITVFNYSDDKYEIQFEVAYGYNNITYNTNISNENKNFPENKFKIRLSNGFYLTINYNLFFKTFKSNRTISSELDNELVVIDGLKILLYAIITKLIDYEWVHTSNIKTEIERELNGIYTDFNNAVKSDKIYPFYDNEEVIKGSSDYFRKKEYLNRYLFTSPNNVTNLVNIKDASFNYSSDEGIYFIFNIPLYVINDKRMSVEKFDFQLTQDSGFTIKDKNIYKDHQVFIDNTPYSATLNIYNYLVIKEVRIKLQEEYENILNETQKQIGSKENGTD